ncbi:MAG: lipoyl synthase [Clostridiaceae bacterium]|nr:lipoyl synthase [Clostridiaceae bacterium]
MIGQKPKWIKKKLPHTKSLNEMNKLLKSLSLNTVCQGAKCPNMGECFKNKTATFMILGDICTRQCKFCAVSKGAPQTIDLKEPENVAIAVKKLDLKHAVITSVTRDDLEDGGAQHFVNTIKEIRKINSHVSIEVLIPDFNGNEEAVEKVIEAKPEIINHNLETVPTLYSSVRPQANYKGSLSLLNQVKRMDADIITKTGLMLGVGESEEDFYKTVEDLVAIDCDILTLGQYLQPSKHHLPVVEYITPEKFDCYKNIAEEKGIRFVVSGPFVRSSYNAIDGFEQLKLQKSL